jgi:hypothetical protein
VGSGGCVTVCECGGKDIIPRNEAASTARLISVSLTTCLLPGFLVNVFKHEELSPKPRSY